MKIFFVHNKAKCYRIPFFELLDKKYNIEFLFTHENSCNTDCLQLNYSLSNHIFGFAYDITSLITKDFEILVIGCCSNHIELIETIVCFFIAKIKRKKFVIWSEQWRKPKKLIKTLALPLIKFVVSHSDAYLAPGRKHREYASFLGASEDRIFFLPNVSNISTISKIDMNKESILKKALNLENKKIILYVGRLIELKGVKYLIKAFKQIEKDYKDVELLIIGDGSKKKELVELSVDLRINNKCKFLGWIDNDDLFQYYMISNIFVLPSIGTDACPLVINEAMYCFKPIITTHDVGSAEDMVKNDLNGYIVKSRDENAIFSAIKKIILNSDLECEMGTESNKIIENLYTYQHMLKSFEECIDYVWRGSK